MNDLGSKQWLGALDDVLMLQTVTFRQVATEPEHISAKIMVVQTELDLLNLSFYFY